MKTRTRLVIVGLLGLVGGSLFWWNAPSKAPHPEDSRNALTSARTRGNSPDLVGAGPTSPLGCRVTSSEGPVTQAYLKLVGQSDPIIVTTDASGVWEGAVPAGAYTVTASSANHFTGTSVEIKVPLAAGATCELRIDTKGVRIAGRVVDATGAPIAHASVDATSLQGTLQALGAEAGATIADAAGQFSLVVRPGALQLRGMHAAFAITSMLIHVAEPRDDIVLALQPGSAIAGLVLDANNQPQAGATVRLAREQSDWRKIARAGADGAFVFEGIGPGTYGITAALGAQITAAPTNVQLENFEAISDVRLVLGAGYVISGRVIDEAGQPVAEAVVTNESSSDETTTDAEGRFRLEGVPPGLAALAAKSKLGKSREPLEVAVIDRSIQDVELTLRATYTLRGRVEPPQPAAVWLIGGDDTFSALEFPSLGTSVHTDANGVFVMEGLSLGAKTVRARGTNGSLGTGKTEVTPTPSANDFVISMATRGSISGQVVDATGQPQAHARIGLMPNIFQQGKPQFVQFWVNGQEFRNAESLTDGSGNFTLVGVRAGAQVFRVADTQGHTLVVRAPTQLTLGEGEAQSGIKVVVDGNDKSLAVTVVDAGGSPVAEAWVRVECAPIFPKEHQDITMGISTSGALEFGQPPRATDASGKTVFGNLPGTASCDVSATSSSGTSFAAKAQVATGGSVTLTLKQNGVLQGTIEPFSAGVIYNVTLNGPDDTQVSDRVVTQTFTMRGLTEGAYRAKVTARQVGRGEASFSIASGKTTDARIVLLANGVVKGRLVDANGVPRAEVGVWAAEQFKEGGSTWHLDHDPPKTDAQGLFSLALPPGVWKPLEIVEAMVKPELTTQPITLGAGQVVDLGDVQAR